MSEENQIQENTEQEDSQHIEPTQAELSAMEQGWVPKDQWKGEGKWRDAEAFLDRGELFSKIDRQNRELKQIKDAMQEFKKHHESVRETEFKRAVAILKSQKKDALREGDADLVVDIDDQIDEMREQQIRSQLQAEKQEATSGNDHPEFVAWKNKNGWYESNSDMRKFADALGVALRDQGNSPNEVLKEVEKTVKEKYSSKFVNPNREKPSGVESTTPGAGTKSKETYVLTPMERTVMNTLVAGKVMTKEKYIADLKAKKEME